MKRTTLLRRTATWMLLACPLAFPTASRANESAGEHHEPASGHAAPEGSKDAASTEHEAGSRGGPAGPSKPAAHQDAASDHGSGNSAGHGSTGSSHGSAPGTVPATGHAEGAMTDSDKAGHAEDAHEVSSPAGESHGEPAQGAAAEGGHGPAASGHGAGGKSAHESPEAMLRKRRLVEADSGLLSGMLPRAGVVWKRTDKPLRLLSDVVVGPGQTLEIGPGVHVIAAARDRAPMGAGDWADSQLVSLIVRGGTLRIAGASNRPVRFVPERQGKGPRWGGIRIEDTRQRPQVDLSWFEIAGALQGIHFDRAAGSVRHAVLMDGNVGLRISGGSAPEILQCVFTGQQVAGLVTEKSGPLVRGCLFLGNAGNGARFEGAGLARFENNAFWNNGGGDLVRPPPGVGGWTSTDSVVPDRFGNVRTEPVLRSSKLHAKLLAQLRDSLNKGPIWKRRMPDPPPGAGPWALSNFSPLLDRGSLSPLCRDRDGTACDIGLWGGKD